MRRPRARRPARRPAATIGPGEGELNLVAWVGYVEDGSNLKDYDWVNPFIAANPDCSKVTVKTADTSDEMYTLMTQGHGLYDGVSASGDASNRLIDRAEVAPVDPAVIPDYKDLTPFLQSPANNTVNNYHYGISHGWGGNTLMYNTKKFTTPPTSWDAVFDPAKMADYKGKVTAYGGSIYLADAALYLMTHKPELKITDPYELTQEQFDAAVALLKEQRPFVGKYWTSFTDEIDNFTNGTTTMGTSWQYQTNTLKGSGVPVEAVVPDRGDDRLVRHVDAVALRQASELHAQVDGLDGHARGPGPGGRVLRRGAGQPEGVPDPRLEHEAVRAQGLLHRLSRHGRGVLQRDQVLEDAGPRLW